METMLRRGVEDAQHPFGPGWRVLHAPTLGRWINPVLGGLGALILTGYLMIGHPSTPAATTPATRPDAPLALSNETGGVTHSSVARDLSTRSSRNDVLNAALGAALAAVWLMGGAWVGIRSARISTPSVKPQTKRADYDRGRY